MEENTANSSNSNDALYKKISNSWNVIFDFLDINSLLQSEIVSKFFRNQILVYYEAKENSIKINKIDSNGEKNEKIKLFKKQFLSKYFNLFVSVNISDKKFCNENKKEEINFELEKTSFPKTESIFYNKKNQIEQISIQDNRAFILYSENIFSVLEFDFLDKAQKFNEIYSYNFGNEIVNKFICQDINNETIIFFIKNNSTEIRFLKLNEKKLDIYDLKKEKDFSNVNNLVIKELYTLNDFILILNNEEEFILIPKEKLGINCTKKDKDKSNVENDDNKKSDKEEENDNDNDDKKEEQIIYPQKLEKNYGSIKYIYSNSLNVIILNNENQLYSIPMSDCKNYENKIPKFKLFSEQKFPNFYTMCGYNNYFLLLEKEKVKPLEKWNTEEVYKWFEEMELDDYLNIIKNQKITGKDIFYGGKDFLIDNMGLEEDHMNKVNYEMNTLKFETSKDMKLWGWGNNKNGQLGLMDYQNFIKAPTQINLPNMISDDTIERIYCGKTYSVLLTKFGNVFITGNYSIKQKVNSNQNNNNNEHHGKKNKGKNKSNKEKDKGKDKNKNKNKENENNINDNFIENKWVNVSQNICYCPYNNSKKNDSSYFRIKDIFCHENTIFFIGFYSNTIPFFAIQRKPKFKHLKKGGKFITSDKVVEHIQEFLKHKMSSFKIIYGDSLLKMLETTLEGFLESEIPYHKIIQIKDGDEIIWDRKKRYFKETFIKETLNKNI